MSMPRVRLGLLRFLARTAVVCPYAEPMSRANDGRVEVAKASLEREIAVLR